MDPDLKGNLGVLPRQKTLLSYWYQSAQSVSFLAVGMIVGLYLAFKINHR